MKNQENHSSFADGMKSKKGFKRIQKAAQYSKDGFCFAYRDEAAFRQLLFLNMVLIILVFFTPFDLAIKILLILCSFISLIVELFNSAIEAAVDHTSLEKSVLAKKAKDLGSAAQSLALILLGIVWGLALIYGR